MKKRIVRSLALILLLAQVFLLCGCNALDEMRQNQGYYDKDGNITRDGITYMPLPECEDLIPESDYEARINITAPDVPVLLSSMFALEQFTVSKDGNFLINLQTSKHYCRESMYDDILARIQKGFTPTVVCYSYGYWDEDSGDYLSKQYVLTQEQVKALELVTGTVQPTPMTEDWSLNYEDSIALEACSEDLLFRRNDLDIAISGDNYYLILYSPEQTLVFAVPDGCNATFDDIVRPYKESVYYSDEYDPYF